MTQRRPAKLVLDDLRAERIIDVWQRLQAWLGLRLPTVEVTDHEPRELARAVIPIGASSWSFNVRVDSSGFGRTRTVAAMVDVVALVRDATGTRHHGAGQRFAEMPYAAWLEPTHDGVRVMVASNGERYRFHLVWLHRISRNGMPAPSLAKRVLWWLQGIHGTRTQLRHESGPEERAGHEDAHPSVAKLEPENPHA